MTFNVIYNLFYIHKTFIKANLEIYLLNFQIRNY